MKKRLVFMGTPQFSAKILKELISIHDVVLVVTQADKRVGRNKELINSPVKKVALDYGLELVQPNKLKNNQEIVDLIANKKPDYIIVAAYGKILPSEILNIAPCINTHASLLPLYRGASPIQSAILNGDKDSGVTLMLMDEGLDTGDILYQEKITIENLNANVVFDNMSELSSKMLINFLDNPVEFTQKKQDHSKATFTKIIKKEDGLIGLDNARNIFCKYLAFYEWPNIFLSNGVKLCDIELNEEVSINQKGLIQDIKKDYMILACSVGTLKVFKVQAPGKKILDIKSYLNGKRLKVGDFFV